MSSESLKHKEKRLMHCRIILGVVYSSKHKEEPMLAEKQGKLTSI